MQNQQRSMEFLGILFNFFLSFMFDHNQKCSGLTSGSVLSYCSWQYNLCGAKDQAQSTACKSFALPMSAICLTLRDFLQANNKLEEREIKTASLTVCITIVKYLGINLIKEVKDLYKVS